MNFLRKLLRTICQNWTCWCNAKKEDIYPESIDDFYVMPEDTAEPDRYADLIEDTYNPKDNG